eukprot:PLAT12826.1.p1 GENE.PLAT12826.1~~PLAT12826.1.p1  ORF type:complete len:387 (-),score=162.52 PLAT12826.1:79-1203(-)
MADVEHAEADVSRDEDKKGEEEEEQQQLYVVTGAGGYIGAHVVRVLLERGYDVRAIVRDPSSDKYDFLKALPGAAEHLQFAAGDLMSDEPWAAAMDGATHVAHVASPFHQNVKDPFKDMINPAVQGTERVLRAASAAGVQRVVVTSSMAAVFEIAQESEDDPVYDENTWNRDSEPHVNPYYVSKTWAEQKAWELSARLGFSMATINPGGVFGPALSTRKATSLDLTVQLLDGTFRYCPNFGLPMVDVRDVAEAHVRALETTGKTRYLMGAVTATFYDMGQYMKPEFDHCKLPKGYLPNWLVKVTASLFAKELRPYAKRLGVLPRVDASLVERELGITYRPFKDTCVEAVDSLVRSGYSAELTKLVGDRADVSPA